MKRVINSIVIHCSATPDYKAVTVAEIDAMHKMRGFKRDNAATRNFNPECKHIGYHFFIDADGWVWPGRGIEEIGAHVQGSNSKSIGICIAGTACFTDEQCATLRQTVMSLTARISGREISTPTACMTTLHDMGIAVKGHRDYSPDLNGDGVIQRNEWMKTCPGFSIAAWLKSGMDKITNEA